MVPGTKTNTSVRGKLCTDTRQMWDCVSFEEAQGESYGKLLKRSIGEVNNQHLVCERTLADGELALAFEKQRQNFRHTSLTYTACYAQDSVEALDARLNAQPLSAVLAGDVAWHYPGKSLLVISQ